MSGAFQPAGSGERGRGPERSEAENPRRERERSRRTIARRVAVLWMLGIAVLSGMASTRAGVAYLLQLASLHGRDKAAHFVLMGGFAFFSVLGFTGSRLGRRRVATSAVLGVVVGLTAAEELLQLWLPLRSFSLWDFAWSLAGIFCLGGVAAGWERWTRLGPDRIPRR